MSSRHSWKSIVLEYSEQVILKDVTPCQIQKDLNTQVLDRYIDVFPKVCTDSVRYCYNKISVLIKGIYKKQYIGSKLNLRVNQINQNSKHNLKSIF